MSLTRKLHEPPQLDLPSIDGGFALKAEIKIRAAGIVLASLMTAALSRYPKALLTPTHALVASHARSSVAMNADVPDSALVKSLPGFGN